MDLRLLVISLAVIIVDQITKWLVVRAIPLYYESGFTIPVFGEFFRLIHARNLGVAFSIGVTLPPQVRSVLFVLLPAAVMLVVVWHMYRSEDTTRGERVALSLILGGGFGNLIDRVFRPEGVVDFLDVKFYGLFGLERWPTFNVADSSVVIGGLLLVLLVVRGRRGA